MSGLFCMTRGSLCWEVHLLHLRYTYENRPWGEITRKCPAEVIIGDLCSDQKKHFLVGLLQKRDGLNPESELSLLTPS